MAAEIQLILAETNDEKLCERLYDWIIQRYGEEIDRSRMPEHERMVICVLYAKGIIENGGFNYLFEGDLLGDPQFLLTADAFEKIGAKDATTAFRRVFQLFPAQKPPADMRTRLMQYRSGDASRRQQIDSIFWSADKEIYRCLATFIRTHKTAYLRHTDSHKRARAKPQRSSRGTATNHPRKQAQTLPERVSQLPHWARAALAARCARTVLPVFRRSWPTARRSRLAAIVRCIAGAEQSAQRGSPVQNIGDIAADGYEVVGAALIGLYGCPFETTEHFPADGNLATAASKAARVAVKAAEAVEKGADGSGYCTSDAVSTALEIAEAVGSEKLARRIGKHLIDVERETAAQNWDDDSPVPPTIFTTSSTPKDRRRWWKFW
jgi:hypothetical protein